MKSIFNSKLPTLEYAYVQVMTPTLFYFATRSGTHHRFDLLHNKWEELQTPIAPHNVTRLNKKLVAIVDFSTILFDVENDAKIAELPYGLCDTIGAIDDEKFAVLNWQERCIAVHTTSGDCKAIYPIPIEYLTTNAAMGRILAQGALLCVVVGHYFMVVVNMDTNSIAFSQEKVYEAYLSEKYLAVNFQSQITIYDTNKFNVQHSHRNRSDVASLICTDVHEDFRRYECWVSSVEYGTSVMIPNKGHLLRYEKLTEELVYIVQIGTRVKPCTFLYNRKKGTVITCCNYDQLYSLERGKSKKPRSTIKFMHIALQTIDFCDIDVLF